MGKVLVIYTSDYGHTRRAAEAVALGAERVPGTSVRSRTTAEATHDDVLDADGLVIGSPVHMGSVHWEMKRFIDQTLSGLWTRDLLVGRVGGVFSTGGGLGGAGGGCEFAMLSMLAVLAELGMIIAPLPKPTDHFGEGGHHWGPYVRCSSNLAARSAFPEQSLTLLEVHGANVARVAALTARQPNRSAFGRATHAPHERNVI